MLYLLWHTSKWAKRDEEKKYTKRMLKCFRRAMLRTHGKRWVVGMEKGWKISGNLRNKKPQRMLTMKRIKFDMFAHSFIRSLFRHVFVFVCVSVACASKLSYLLDIRLCALWFALNESFSSAQHIHILCDFSCSWLFSSSCFVSYSVSVVGKLVISKAR